MFHFDGRVCVESALSKFSEADIQTGSTDSLFIKSPASGMAEERTFMAILPTGRSVSLTVHYEQLLFGG
jgi:hypothetical protein